MNNTHCTSCGIKLIGVGLYCECGWSKAPLSHNNDDALDKLQSVWEEISGHSMRMQSAKDYIAEFTPQYSQQQIIQALSKYRQQDHQKPPRINQLIAIIEKSKAATRAMAAPPEPEFVPARKEVAEFWLTEIRKLLPAAPTVFSRVIDNLEKKAINDPDEMPKTRP